VAEDNEINQQIAVELLEQAGARVTVAGNGREAVDELEDGLEPAPFDVVLMDLQMPEMDGYQATARLRADARFASLPIIAMTAHATIEERQRCLAVGMNDHISKPIDPANLIETVSRFFTTAGVPTDIASPDHHAAASELFSMSRVDTRDGLARVAGNHKLFLKLLRQFVEQQGSAVGQIAEALKNGSTEVAERMAHTLKGVAANLGVREVPSAAGAVEKLIRDRARSEDVSSSLRHLGAVLDPLMIELRSVLQRTPAQPAGAPAPSITPIVDPVRLRETTTHLKVLLAESDPGAADFVEANAATLSPLFGDGTWATFESRVQGYDFAGAQEQLEQALERYPSNERPLA
jgi:two-component system sensor histidine kinase/response regulator